MKKTIKIMGIVSMVAVIFALTACRALDVVGNQSVASFQAVLEAAGDKVAPDEANAGWSLAAPDGAARFIWSKDYSKSPLHDVMLEFDAKPFIDAGLDTGKLPKEIVYFEGKLMVGTKLGNDVLTYKGDPTPLTAYEQIVNRYPTAIGYHSALKHYGINLGNGNLFEWAKDMSTNDKDIVFVLNPEPFLNAGVDPNAIKGWAFAKVTVDVDGKPTQVDKILKPFNLK